MERPGAGPAAGLPVAGHEGVILHPYECPDVFARVIVDAVDHVKDEVCITSPVKGVTVDPCAGGCRQLGKYVMVFQKN